MRYLVVVLQVNLFPEYREQGLLVRRNEGAVDRLPERVFPLEDVLETRVLLGLL